MKKIAVITGSRAEFGLLCRLMHAIDSNPNFELQVIVTAMHLSSYHGNTINDIINEGFKINRKVDCLLSSDTAVGISKSIGLAVISLSEVYDDIKPDAILILGDRTEALAAAITAMTANIPIMHIHGGESTIGSYDEAIRHSITKMASLHFTAAEEYRKRVIQLGEHPDTVFNVGSLGVENINNNHFLKREELNDVLDFKLKDKNFLVLFHPETRDNKNINEQIDIFFDSLKEFRDYQIVFSLANSDENGSTINNKIFEFVKQNPNNSVLFHSLKHSVYLSLLRQVDVIIGNSSSGIIEAPCVATPTVSVGDRQKGRLKAPSIIESDYNKEHILEAIDKATKYRAKNIKSFYGNENTVESIIKILEKHSNLIIKKSFYDIPIEV